MIRLLDGPAIGAYALERAPLYLRAVVDAAGKIDCLDQITDTPRDDERVHVYRQTEYRGPVILRLARPTRCVWTHSADYVHLPDVDGEQFRDTNAWQTWARAEHDRNPVVGITS